MSEQKPVRLQKVIAAAGIASRRAAEALIAAGKVTVNGEVARLGQRVDARTDEIKVEGVGIRARPEMVHLAFNKPRGVITTASDPQGRPTVMQVAGVESPTLPAGRLDVDTEGLLILTNDGELAHRLTHPSYEVSKVYQVEVEGSVAARTLNMLLSVGVDIGEGSLAQADGATVVARSEVPKPRTMLELEIHEGRNRVVRRMMQAVGHPVTRLVRTRIGPVTLGRLKPGTTRKLTAAELTELARLLKL